MVPATWLIELVLLDVAVAENSLWLLRAVAVLLLAVLPGQLLLHALRVPAASIRRYVAYLPCASVAVLIASTLRGRSCRASTRCARATASMAIVGWAEPGLPGLAYLGHRAADSCELKSSDLIGHVRWFWPLLLPLVSVVAAARLDNGDGNVLAIVVLVAVAVMIPTCTVLANGMHRRQMNFVLYSGGLALMLLTSMRSSYVIGFDINSEYFDFHQTVVNGIWHFGHLNPYEAMLSLTVLAGITSRAHRRPGRLDLQARISRALRLLPGCGLLARNALPLPSRWRSSLLRSSSCRHTSSSNSRRSPGRSSHS